jgi:hypothetical protein
MDATDRRARSATEQRQPTLTREELVRHKVPVYTLAAPVRGWLTDGRGNVAEEFTIPTGSQLVNVTRAFCHAWLSRHGDRCIADVLFRDGRHGCVFFSAADAAKALPEDVPEMMWCTESQTYEPCAP